MGGGPVAVDASNVNDYVASKVQEVLVERRLASLVRLRDGFQRGCAHLTKHDGPDAFYARLGACSHEDAYALARAARTPGLRVPLHACAAVHARGPCRGRHAFICGLTEIAPKDVVDICHGAVALGIDRWEWLLRSIRCAMGSKNSDRADHRLICSHAFCLTLLRNSGMDGDTLRDLLYFATASRHLPASSTVGGTGSRIRFVLVRPPLPWLAPAPRSTPRDHARHTPALLALPLPRLRPLRCRRGRRTCP